MSSSLGIIGKDTFVQSAALGENHQDIPVEFTSRLKQIVSRYPSSKSAVMPALYLAQEHYGWLSREAISWVSKELDLPQAHVESVATFYTMYYKRPVGKYHVQVCRTLSCMICGARKLTDYLKNRTGLNAGEISKDGFWSYEEVECLGSCGTAPMIQINDVFFENLTPDTLAEAMDLIEKERPDLRYSTLNGVLGTGLPEQPRSRVL